MNNAEKFRKWINSKSDKEIDKFMKTLYCPQCYGLTEKFCDGADNCRSCLASAMMYDLEKSEGDNNESK